MPYLIGLLSFLAVALATYEVFRPRTNRAVLRASGQGVREVRAVDRTGGNMVRRVLAPFIARWGHRIASLLPQNVVRGVNRMLIMANEPWSLPGFLFAWVITLALGVGVFYYLVAVSPDITAVQVVVLALMTIPTAAIAPYALLRHKVKRRQNAILRALPDAMDLLVTSIEAGLGIDAAFALVVEKTSGAIAETLGMYLRAVGFGRSRRDALEDMAQRTGVPELIGIAHAVNQAEQLGSTLGDILRVQAEDLRVARRQRAEAAAQRAPVLMTIPLVTCFLPAIGAVVLVPSILNLIKFTAGIRGG